MTHPIKRPNPLLTSADIEDLPECRYQHPINKNGLRYTRSLGDATGLNHIGIHLVRLEPGNESSETHFHHREEEFIYILSGRGIADIGEEEIEVASGYFMGFAAGSVPHNMRNPFDQPLLYLVGGQRERIDVIDYTNTRQRLYRVNASEQIIEY